MSEEIIVSIPKINCTGCVNNVRRTLQQLPSVEVVTIDHVTKTAHFRYTTEEISFEVIRATLAEARYPITDTRYPASSDTVQKVGE